MSKKPTDKQRALILAALDHPGTLHRLDRVFGRAAYFRAGRTNGAGKAPASTGNAAKLAGWIEGEPRGDLQRGFEPVRLSGTGYAVGAFYRVTAAGAAAVGRTLDPKETAAREEQAARIAAERAAEAEADRVAGEAARANNRLRDAAPTMLLALRMIRNAPPSEVSDRLRAFAERAVSAAVAAPCDETPKES